MQQHSHESAVIALFASATAAERIAVKLYAASHEEVTIAANVATGRELLALLAAGLTPAVIVVDAPLEDVDLHSLLGQIAVYCPRSAVLVSTRVQCGGTLHDLLLTFPRHSAILKPWKLEDLFSNIYMLGVECKVGRVYRVRSQCSRLLDTLQAGSALIGRAYLQEMVVRNVLAGQDFTVGELKLFAAQRYDTGVEAVTAALNRVNQQMFRGQTPLYRRLALRNGQEADAKLPVGQLVKSLTIELRYKLEE